MLRTILAVVGITVASLVVGVIAFFIFRAIFSLWIVALIVAITTAVCLAIVGGFAIVGNVLKMEYQRQQELSSRKKWVFGKRSLSQSGDKVVDSTISYPEEDKKTQKGEEAKEGRPVKEPQEAEDAEEGRAAKEPREGEDAEEAEVAKDAKGL